MIDEVLLENFRSLIDKSARVVPCKAGGAHPFPGDIQLTTREEACNRMATQVMHPAFLYKLAHEGIL